MHESLEDGITSRVVTTSGDLFNPEIVVHCRNKYTHELGRVIAPELERDSFDKDEPNQREELWTRFLACDSEEAKRILLESRDLSQDLALGVSVEVDTILLSRQWLCPKRAPHRQKRLMHTVTLHIIHLLLFGRPQPRAVSASVSARSKNDTRKNYNVSLKTRPKVR